MTVPLAVLSGATSLLAQHPRLGSEGDRRSLLLSAGIDDSLIGQVDLGGAPFPFLANVLDALGDYGSLADGRDALTAFLEASKQLLGLDGRQELDGLIELWGKARNSTPALPPAIRDYMQLLRDSWTGLDSPLLPDLTRLADVAVGLKVVGAAQAPGDDWADRSSARPDDARLVGTPQELSELISTVTNTSEWLLLGDPGSGKTTVMIREAGQRAQRVLDLTDPVIPIFITLADLGALAVSQVGFSLFEYLDQYAEPRGLRNLGAELRKFARQGRLLYLFDGWDEVPERARRYVSELITAGTQKAAGNRVVVTSRRVGVGRFLNHRRIEVAPLTVGDQRSLLLAICGVERTRRVLPELSSSAELIELARNPMMLTVLGLVARESPELSIDYFRRHSDLFRVATRLLLEGRHRDRGGVVDSGKAATVLSAASLQLHAISSLPGGGEVFTDQEVESAVSRADQSALDAWASPRAFIDDVSSQSNIVYPVNSISTRYRYLHRTMREFFAAQELADLPTPDRRRIVAAMSSEQPWAEVIVLLGGLVSDVEDYLHQVLMGPPDLALRTLQEARTLNPSLALDALALQSLHLRDRRKVFVELRRKLPTSVLLDVLHAYLEEVADMVPRADLYFVKQELLRVGTTDSDSILADLFSRLSPPPPDLLMLPPNMSATTSYWCKVQGGMCIVGAAPDDPDKPAWVPEYTSVHVPAFEIARVPVTNAIYDTFDPSHRARRAFQEDVEMRELDHHPAVSVSWYEAAAFCDWAAWSTPGIRLVNEVEWEKAASWTGSRKLRYPWGDQWDPEKLNTWESGPNRTTSVDAYPDGSSPTGALDMAGNVWEWCADWFSEEYPVNRQIGLTEMGKSIDAYEPTSRRIDRGGGWYHDVGRPTTSLRAADDPGDRFTHCGFRIARQSPG